MQVQAINSNNQSFKGKIVKNDALKNIINYVKDDNSCILDEKENFLSGIKYIFHKTPKIDTFELKIGDGAIRKSASLYKNGEKVMLKFYSSLLIDEQTAKAKAGIKLLSDYAKKMGYSKKNPAKAKRERIQRLIKLLDETYDKKREKMERRFSKRPKIYPEIQQQIGNAQTKKTAGLKSTYDRLIGIANERIQNDLDIVINKIEKSN